MVLELALSATKLLVDIVLLNNLEGLGEGLTRLDY
jgi:hypothetical protein